MFCSSFSVSVADIKTARGLKLIRHANRKREREDFVMWGWSIAFPEVTSHRRAAAVLMNNMSSIFHSFSSTSSEVSMDWLNHIVQIKTNVNPWHNFCDLMCKFSGPKCCFYGCESHASHLIVEVHFYCVCVEVCSCMCHLLMVMISVRSAEDSSHVCSFGISYVGKSQNWKRAWRWQMEVRNCCLRDEVQMISPQDGF